MEGGKVRYFHKGIGRDGELGCLSREMYSEQVGKVPFEERWLGERRK